MNPAPIISIALLILVVFFWKIYPTEMFITAWFSGSRVSFFDMLRMKLRKVDVDQVTLYYILLRKGDFDIKIRDLERAYLSKRDLKNITHGLILSRRHNVPMTFEQAVDTDSKGINILDELKQTVATRNSNPPLTTNQ